jgi:hypothetical protein
MQRIFFVLPACRGKTYIKLKERRTMLCCFGGVCVPYTAVVPILILALKWVATKLAQMGLLPKVLQQFLNLPKADGVAVANDETSAPIGNGSSGPSIVKALESEVELDKLLLKDNQKVVCKFTAR